MTLFNQTKLNEIKGASGENHEQLLEQIRGVQRFTFKQLYGYSFRRRRDGPPCRRLRGDLDRQ